jgi:hypothetical protein
MSRRTTRKTEAAPKTVEAKTMMSDLKSGKDSLPPEVKKEDGPQVEPVAQPPAVGPPPDEAPPEEAQAQPADAPPEEKTEATAAEAEAQSGNDSLPQAEATEAQRTEGQADQADDEDAQEVEGDPDDEDEGDPDFTDRDCQDLTVLERQAKTAGLEEAKALREIRQRQLWKSIKDEDGKRRYQTFDDYCQERLGHTRQFVTQRCNWLARMELLASCRAKGFDVPAVLNPTACNSLYRLDLCGHFRGTDAEKEEQGLRAVLCEAVNDGLKLTGDNLRTVCERLKAYYGALGSDKPAAPTYADYKDDCKMLEEIAGMSWDWNIHGIVVKEQQESGASYAESVGKVYLQEGKRPKNSALLHHATGDDLRLVVDQLLVARKKLEAVENAKQAKAEARQKDKEATEALEAAQRQAGINKKAKGKGKGEDGNGEQGNGNGKDGDEDDGDQNVELKLRYRLKKTPPAVNPDAWDFEDWDGLLIKLTELKDEHKPKKPGGTYFLPLAITVKAVSASEDEKLVQDAERMVQEEQG